MRNHRPLACTAGLVVLALAACLCGCGAAGEPKGKEAAAVLTVTSPAFGDGQKMPGRSVERSIPLRWTGVPAATRSLAVTTIDHDPVANMWVHWMVVAIPPETTSIPEGAYNTSAMPPGATELRNTSGGTGWSGPKPPPGSGPHDYATTVYALDIDAPPLPAAPKAGDFDRAVEGHVLASGSITGAYSR